MKPRRNFILISTLAVGGAISGVYLYRSTIQSPAELAVGEIVSRLAAMPGAVRFGEKFREELDKNGRPLKSATSLSGDLVDVHGDVRPDNIGNVLEQQIQMELRTNQVHVIEGWYLTRTELDLCALASIARKS